MCDNVVADKHLKFRSTVGKRRITDGSILAFPNGDVFHLFALFENVSFAEEAMLFH